MALIDFAAQQCDQLIVSLNETTHDPISPNRRLGWLHTLLTDRPNITIASVLDDFHNDSLPLEAATRIWAAVIRQHYPRVNVLFSSEAYGPFVARHLGIRHVAFDPDRRLWPVSASLIRQQPAQYWSFIPEVVRPFFVKKLCLYGPESVGKTTLARQLAEEYNTVFVPEVARNLITSNDFSLADIARIGHAQTEAVLAATQQANRILFCDTDVITTRIYSDIYLNEVPPVLAELEQQVTYNQYILLDIDVPWVADGLRDLGHRRQELFDRFRAELEQRTLHYTLVSGSFSERHTALRELADYWLTQPGPTDPFTL